MPHMPSDFNLVAFDAQSLGYLLVHQRVGRKAPISMLRIRCNFCDGHAEFAEDQWRQEFLAMACFG
jgi:hypothetical protein